MYAIDSLRQLACKFLEKDELSNFQVTSLRCYERYPECYKDKVTPTPPTASHQTSKRGDVFPELRYSCAFVSPKGPTPRVQHTAVFIFLLNVV